MALPKAYLTSSKNLNAILSAIQGAQAPEKFTQSFLDALGYKSSSDRLIIGVLKALGFLHDDGKPTERYFRFLDQTQSATVLAEAIREAYTDLFQINVNANKLTRADLINKLKTLGQGKLSDAVLDKMAMTFSELVKLADFKLAPIPQLEKAEKRGEKSGDREEDHADEGTRRVKLGGLVYNIQLVLPESRDPAVYDALFRSLREHLV